jgi:hypothetical protein
LTLEKGVRAARQPAATRERGRSDGAPETRFPRRDGILLR